MFELDEVKNYWCIVSLTQPNFMGNTYNEVLILHLSSDSTKDELLSEGLDAGDNGLDVEWADGLPVGLYRLALTPTFDYDESDQAHFIDGAKVEKVDLLYEFPSSDSE